MWGDIGKGYKELWPDDWEDRLEEKMHGSLGLRCVTDIMTHVVLESKRMYKGTKHESDFIIFHDGLSAWWEKGAQEYMASLGFRNRQLRCIGPTNSDNRYTGKLVGDSPEMCRGLDAYGFSYLKLSMNYNIALSSLYPVGDIRRMSMATPEDVMETIQKCWTLEPTSEQIITDIFAFPDVLKKIIAADGCVVPDMALRTGRRYVHATRGGELKRKPRARQRKHTMLARVCHPDCIEARESIRNDTEVVPMFPADSSEDDSDESSHGISGGEIIPQKFEIGALVKNPFQLGCKVLSYNGRGLYEVEFDVDGDVRTIQQHQLRPRGGTTRKTIKPSFTYEIRLPADEIESNSSSGITARRRNFKGEV